MEAINYRGTAEQLLCEKATFLHVPINGILELTPLCSMNCEMCYVRLSPEEQRKKGPLLSLAEWCSIADEMQRSGTLFVLLTGGEPLLYPSFRELYLYLQKMGMYVTVNSNGTLLDENWADFFGRHKPRRINITIYGKDPETYERLCHHRDGYEKAVQAIRLLKERHVDVKLNGSITPLNAEDGPALAALAKQLDVPWKIDTYMYPGSREREQRFQEQARLSAASAAKVRVLLMQQGHRDFEQVAANLLRKAESPQPDQPDSLSVSCRAGRSSFAINWQGMMRPCILVTEPEIAVLQHGFQAAWEQLVDATAKIRLSPVCARCEMRQVCQTCAACAFLETGHFDGTPEYMCQYTRETLRLLQERLKTLPKEEPHG